MSKAGLQDPSEEVKFNEHNFIKENDEVCRAYFDEQVSETEQYWQRLGGRPDFRDKTVLELGCGHGALCVDAALAGAKRVIGIDLISNRIEFAKRHVADRFPKLTERMEFDSIDIADLRLDGEVDYILSKDTFEHILGLGQVLQAVKRILKPGGMLISGFSPLYNSPYGDHGFHAVGKKRKWPWAHLMLGDAYVVKAYNATHPGVDAKTIYDLGLNKLRRRDFLKAFEQAGLTLEYEKVNALEGASKLMPLFRVLRHVPGLTDLTTVNMYVKLRKGVAS
jgi:2-polyprenyl-3-methyl-5-hydroxy-6-metoxy-1,4-benzoquinol methylase